MQNINEFSVNSCFVYLFQWEARIQTGFRLLSAKFSDPLPCRSPLPGHMWSLFPLVPFCRAGFRPRRSGCPAWQAGSGEAGCQPRGRAGLCRCPGPPPAVLCRNSSASLWSTWGCSLPMAERHLQESATAFGTHSRRQNLLGSDRKTPASLGGC